MRKAKGNNAETNNINEIVWKTFRNTSVCTGRDKLYRM